MDTNSKSAYLSPSTGVLDISVVKDSRPYISITLDLGIPNFTIFSLKLPIVEDKPSTMTELTAEAVHAILDEVSAFMLSCNYKEEVIVQIYSAVLACFKGMTDESDTNKALSALGKDPTVKSYEGTFKLPMSFINETYDRVVTAAGKVIKRPPQQRRIEFSYEKPNKVNVNDAKYVIKNYRGRSLKTQPSPMYVIVYDQTGKARGTIPLGGGFKNQLLTMMYKKGSTLPEFTSSIKFNSEIELKMTNAEGIPKSVHVADKAYKPEAYIGNDMALYTGEGEWVVKFVDGRCVPFADYPTIDKLRLQNYPIPDEYTDWITFKEEDIPEISELEDSMDENGIEVIEDTETEVAEQTDTMGDDEKAEQDQNDRTASVKKADHYNDEGYWAGAGNAASGILPICSTTGRICLAWRNADIHQGDCWGTIGGAIVKGLSPVESAKKELAEETGFTGAVKLVPAYVFTDGGFTYSNFLGIVPAEFGLDPMDGGSAGIDFEDETDALEWFTLEDLEFQIEKNQSDFHPGLIALIENSWNQIQQICNKAGNRDKET